MRLTMKPVCWELGDGQQRAPFYPVASCSRSWQAMRRIPWGRQLWIVPLFVQRCSCLRSFTVEREPEQRN